MRRFRTVSLLSLALAAMLTVPTAARAQDDTEAVMVAAAQWARRGLPAGPLRLDPHRSGRAAETVAQRVARTLGADLGTLEDTRRCTDVMDPSSCTLSAAVLLAITEPQIRGDEARVRVYAWYRQDSAREPVGKQSWDLTLRRTGGSWQVQGQSRLD
jgi:hypothetical protein